MAFFKWLAVTAAVVALAAYGQVAARLVESLTTSERKTQDDTPANHNLPFSYVSFSPRGANLKLAGWYVSQPGNQAALVFVHGIASTRSSLQRVDLAARLLPQGFNILLFDLRGHGSSEGDKVSGGYYEQADVLGAFDFAHQQGISANYLGVLGSSLGGSATILAATQEPALQAVVADGAYANIFDVVVDEAARQSSLPRWSIPFFIPGMTVVAQLAHGINLTSLRPEAAVEELAYPLLIIHGAADTRIPVAQSQRLHAAAPAGSQLWLVPEAEHANGFAHQPEEYTRRVSEYFAKQFSAQENSCGL